MINFGIIGTSKISDQFVNVGKTHKNFNALAVYSRNIETASAFSRKHNLKYSYTDINIMAKEKLIDAVYIASPNSFHFKHAELFLKNKIPVLLEKPLVSNEKEAKEIFIVSENNKTLLMEGLIPVFEPRIKTAYKNLEKLGKIRRITADYSQYSSRFDNFKEGIIENAFNKDLSNGAVMDLGIYVIEPIIQTFGLPNNIKASSSILEGGVDGQGSLLLSYGEMEAVLTFSKIAGGYQSQEIQGENATMIIPRRLSDINQIIIIYKDGRKEIIKYNQDKAPMYYEIDEFISLIKNERISSSFLKKEGTINTFKLIDEYRRQIGLRFPADL